MKCALIGVFALLCWTPVPAQEAGSWMFQTSVYTLHFDPEPNHSDDQRLIGLEHYPRTNRMVGWASFRNTFDQRSWYLFAGRRWDHPAWPVYGKLTGGLLYGYQGEFKNEVPLNHGGYSPGAFPSVGVQLGRYQAEVVLFGVFGVVVNLGIEF